ncbi:MAG: TonB-dependent receptor [Bacteroidia bacterium]|nr:TonB-dependent receptor [Bacteroidia bacterium]MDW8302572.1 TonB-dependent receptor [Bacteroidia bacterium]
MCIKKEIFWLALLCLTKISWCQKITLSGRIITENNEKIEQGYVLLKNSAYQTETDIQGNYKITNIPPGRYTVVAFALGKSVLEQEIYLQKDTIVYFTLKNLENEYDAITIQAEREKSFGLQRMKSVENFGIYEGKKTEVIVLDDIYANLSTNNPRQVYARITGLNVWESDQAGLQLGIGGRGLSPNRTANFNVRQNGYDISADALGYPEAYYTPPTEALERIEIIRGAASLQYGTQFGGMLNFRFKQPEKEKKLLATLRQSAGSWGFWNSFSSFSGTIQKFSYYTYYQFKRSDGYRPNSTFYSHNAFASLNYQLCTRLSFNLELTKMFYLAQQPGGLTDRAFQINPRQSFRERNWFSIDWNLASFNATYKINQNTQINVRNFGLFANRKAVGNLERINMIDFGKERTVIEGIFKNIGNETRLLHNYTLLQQKHTFLIGARMYRGSTKSKQGLGTAGKDPNFTYLNPDNLENSDYIFPSNNIAIFVENIFNISSKLSITPGLRWEYIHTLAQGYYKLYVKDGAGNILVEQKIYEKTERKRNFMLAGLGLSYKASTVAEFYANVSQNYRAINFSDLRINNPNLKVDPNIRDEKGYTADIGIRGSKNNFFFYELTLFYLYYQGKIGQVLRTDTILFNDYRLRTNVANAVNKGVEAFAELNILQLFNIQTWQCNIFTNFSFVDARYVGTQDKSIQNKKVEMVPPVVVRLGNTLRYKEIGASLQYAYTAQHFSDATNAIRTATAVEGLIPAYTVVDVSLFYQWKCLRAEFSINNLLNASYFTRRADAYPGPGIIPADGRAFYVTVQLTF